MNKIALTVGAIGLASLAARATINVPVGASEYATDATGLADVKAIYGTTGYPLPSDGKKTSMDLSVSNGAVTLTGTYADEPTGTYTANMGLIQPIDPSWCSSKPDSSYDISGMTSIEMDVNLATAATVEFSVQTNIEGYSQAMSNSGYVHIASLDLDAGPTHVKLAPSAFKMVSWVTAAQCPTCKTINFTSNILTHAKAIQVAPKTGYSGTGVGPTITSQTMSVKNIVINGVDAISKVQGTNCTGTAYPLMEWATATQFNQNAEGGYWYNYTDTTSLKPTNDSAIGNSQWTSDPVFDADGGHFGATLEKTTADGKYHPYGGSAALGTGFKDADNNDISIKMGTLKAVQFTLSGVSLSDLVDGINFKVGLEGVSNDVTHAVMIPRSQIAAGGKICVDVSSLAQPGWYTNAAPFDGSIGVTKLLWEAKIADQKNSAIHTAAAQKFTINSVNLYGVDASTMNAPSGITYTAGQAAFAATYAAGVLKVSGLNGYRSVDVVTLSGSKVASFDPSVAAKLNLGRGTYMLIAHGANKTLVRSLPVIY